ncbi:MAG: phosphotransferase [Bacteriovoracaceae bacterium]|nr:phosphotransferase [Bacteriovoracaceae bacterium]
MDIIKTSIVFTKTIKNMARLKEIISIFAKNGFDEFFSGKITSNIPNFVLPSSKVKIKEELANRQKRDWPQIIGYRLRRCFEELGPSFIKFGQLLGTREDIFDPSFIHEMKILRDQAGGMSFDVAKRTIEESLGRKIEDIFLEINHKPVGKASIGVVFEGKLKNGSEVVIKVRRPDIIRIIETDFNILGFLIGRVERFSDEVKSLGISRIVDDFEASLHNELNFNIEALNCVRFDKNIKRYDADNLFHVPRVYKEYTTEDILVLEQLRGIPFSNKNKIHEIRDDVSGKIEKAIEIFSKTYLNDGFFHADLHGGNLFWLPNGQIGVIDFGLMGNLSGKGRRSFVAIIYALLTHNYENLVYEFLDVAEYDVIPDVNSLIHDVRQALLPYVGLTFSDINSSQLLNIVVKTMTRHNLFVPREWIIIFRSLITLDGVGKSLDLDCDFFSILEKNIHEIIASSFNKDELIEEGIWAMRDVMSSARLIPRHLKWFLKEWSKNKFAMEIKTVGHKREFNNLFASMLFLSFSFLTGVFVFAGVLSMDKGDLMLFNGISLISGIFWVIASLWLATGFVVLKRVGGV